MEPFGLARKCSRFHDRAVQRSPTCGTAGNRRRKLTVQTLHVLVLFGGPSAEHEVSVRSAATVLQGLASAGFVTSSVGIARDGQWYLLSPPELSQTLAAGQVAAAAQPVAASPGERPCVLRSRQTGEPLTQPIDVVFPVLHGPGGEDGSLQGFLEVLGVPYVGAPPLGSAIGMDKEVQKLLLQAAGIPVVPFSVFHRAQWPATANNAREWAAAAGYPIFVKPANLGSSVGITKVSDPSQLVAAMETAFAFDRKVILEKGLVVREIECAVLGNETPQASLLGEIRPRHSFYSYEAKYLDPNGAELFAPAPLEGTLVRRAQELACTTFRVLQCAGMARVDFFLTPEGLLYVNEINTIPGFTSISMFPRLWEVSGLSLPALVDRLIGLARERHRQDPRTGHRGSGRETASEHGTE